jgi:hypothetical protein
MGRIQKYMIEIRNVVNILARNFKGNISFVKPRTGKIAEIYCEEGYYIELGDCRAQRRALMFISVFSQLDAQNLFHNKFYFMPLHVSSICARNMQRHEIKLIVKQILCISLVK